MTFRLMASRTLLAAACGMGLLYGPTLPTADAAPCAGGAIRDPVTGICWSQSGGVTMSGTGGQCQPGRLGLCLGALQNSQLPGDNLPVDTSVRTSGTWP